LHGRLAALSAGGACLEPTEAKLRSRDNEGNSQSVFLGKWRTNMRLDKYLKVSRLIKRRTVANEACDAGRVLVNGKVAKASLDVKVGDVIEIQFGTKAVSVRVTDIQDTTKKEQAKELFEYLS
jgi:ribosomal 50S subunit-recycling heat shock protein